MSDEQITSSPEQADLLAWVFCWWERQPVIRRKRCYPWRPADHYATREGAVRAGRAWIAKRRSILDEAEARLNADAASPPPRLRSGQASAEEG